MPAFDKNHGEAMRKAVKSGREVAESLGLFGTDLMRKSLSFRHAPGVIRTHNLLIRSQMLYPIELRVRKDPETSPGAGKVKRLEPHSRSRNSSLKFRSPTRSRPRPR
jgi:hypothetical protein